jgi:hypothetical protein
MSGQTIAEGNPDLAAILKKGGFTPNSAPSGEIDPGYSGGKKAGDPVTIVDPGYSGGKGTMPKELIAEKEQPLDPKYLEQRFHIKQEGPDYDAKKPGAKIVKKVQEILGLEQTGKLDEKTVGAIEADKKEASKYHDTLAKSGVDINIGAIPEFKTHPKVAEKETHERETQEHDKIRLTQADNQAPKSIASLDVSAIRKHMENTIQPSDLTAEVKIQPQLDLQKFAPSGKGTLSLA